MLFLVGWAVSFGAMALALIVVNQLANGSIHVDAHKCVAVVWFVILIALSYGGVVISADALHKM